MILKSLAITFWVIAAIGGLAYATDQPSAVPEKSTVTGYRPNIVVYKNHHCDCCVKWVEHLEANRFTVRVVHVDDLGNEKARVGIPKGKDACHTAEIEGYFIEGHVPADDIKRLIRTKPEAKGLTVPGMPIGSPGMEQGKRLDYYEVLLVDNAGNTSVFSRYGK
jgi:hypothetical protein